MTATRRERRGDRSWRTRVVNEGLIFRRGVALGARSARLLVVNPSSLCQAHRNTGHAVRDQTHKSQAHGAASERIETKRETESTPLRDAIGAGRTAGWRVG